MEELAPEAGISLFRVPLGTGRGARFTGNFERQMKEGSGKGASLSMTALDLEGGHFYRVP